MSTVDVFVYAVILSYSVLKRQDSDIQRLELRRTEIIAGRHTDSTADESYQRGPKEKLHISTISSDNKGCKFP